MSVLADARAVLAAGPVCDACLGRAFADRSFGLTNAERGRALRTTVALEDDEPYEAPGDCWVCEGRCSEHDEWAERVVAALDDVDFETYQVGTRVPPLLEENDVLLRADAGLPEDAGETFKSAFNREVGKRVGQQTGTEVDFERPDVVALLNLERGDVAGQGPAASGTSFHAVDVQVNPAFVYGRYRKLERDIPQTEWPCRECGGSGKAFDPDAGEVDCDHCDGAGYMYPTSVEQEVAPAVREAMDGDEAVFHGAGREDVDARMLGTGRPFVVEVKDPSVRRPDVDDLRAAVAERADGVAVDSLALATHEMVERVKELDASKRYRADVSFDEAVAADALADALAEVEGATITQHTPDRVDHRRASIDRTREVYDAEGWLLAPDTPELPPDADWTPAESVEESARAVLTFHTEGGLYVKELVSGDEGRTEPSVAGLLDVDASVTALDVLSVEGEDDPFATDEFLLDADGGPGTE
jgi:tRNA pseudouridine synthase 10